MDRYVDGWMERKRGRKRGREVEHEREAHTNLFREY